MAHIQVHAKDVELSSPVLVEGLPGAGLVGKIAADHLVDEFDMRYYGAIHCEGLPRVAVYRGESSGVLAPVRLYVDEETELLVLQSDVPVSPSSATEFATCITGWLDDHGVLPLYLSGIAAEKDGVPELYGVATGGADEHLDEAGIVPPREAGLVTGPTGALLYRAEETGMDAVGLIVETEPQFPDPESARRIIEHGIEPIAGVEIDTDALLEHAGEIQEAREELAKRLQETDLDESSQAQPIRGFQ